MSSADHYRAKAKQCFDRAAHALTPQEKDDWLKLAAEWESLALDMSPSGQLPWTVQAG